MYDSIGVCVARDDFKPDVKECLAELLKDEQPCLLLMRTAIVASMNLGEVRKFVLTDVIPDLVRKQVWAKTQSRSIWEGVCHFVKRFSGSKDVEQTMRCLLGLPTAQLKVLIKLAPTAKAAMGKTLKGLSAADKEEVLSGRWADLDTTTQKGEKAVLDSDKNKIINQCLAEAAAAPTK